MQCTAGLSDVMTEKATAHPKFLDVGRFLLVGELSSKSPEFATKTQFQIRKGTKLEF